MANHYYDSNNTKSLKNPIITIIIVATIIKDFTFNIGYFAIIVVIVINSYSISYYYYNYYYYFY